MANNSFSRNTPVPVPVRAPAPVNGSAGQMTQEAKRILDQVLVRSMRLTTIDREVLSNALRHASSELLQAADKIQAGRVPGELAGTPATLAFLAAMTILVGRSEMKERFTAFVAEMGKVA